MMTSHSLSIVLQIFVIALIVFAVRWLLSVDGALLPKVRGSTNIYGLKWQFRLAGLGSAAAFAALIIGFRDELIWGPDRKLLPIPAAFVLLSLFFISGSITTDQNGITKKVLWFSRSFRWSDITAVLFYEKQRYIELRANSRKLTIDMRFVAIKQLLDEIIDHTKIQPTKK
jgi:hypothetical protein